MAADPSYLASLMALPTVERERLLGGNWKIRPAAGLLFKRGWVQVVMPSRPVLSDGCAGGTSRRRRRPRTTIPTPPPARRSGSSPTAGTSLRTTRAISFRLPASSVDQKHRGADGREVHISLPQDPGQAGKSQVTNLTKLLAAMPSEPHQSQATRSRGSARSRRKPRPATSSCSADRGMKLGFRRPKASRKRRVTTTRTAPAGPSTPCYSHSPRRLRPP